MTRGRPQSPARSAIETLLQQLYPLPLTQQEIADRLHLPLADVMRHMANMVNARRATRTNPEHRPARYRAHSIATATAAPQPAADEGSYCGRELLPYTGRPGAMHAFGLPSVVNGRRVERQRPTLMASDVRNWTP